MAATTTENNTDLPNPVYLRPYSTQCGYSTGDKAFTVETTDGSSGTTVDHKLGGFSPISTGMEQVRFPINSPGAKSMIVAVFEGIGPTSTYYGFIGIKKSVGGSVCMGSMSSSLPASVGVNIFASTDKKGWDMYPTTAGLIQTATENATYILGPLDLTNNYLSLGGTSGAAIDSGQYFIQVTGGYTSIAMYGSTIAYSEFSTNHPLACDDRIYVAHFEVP